MQKGNTLSLSYFGSTQYDPECKSNGSKGFAPILILVGALLVSVVGAYYLGRSSVSPPSQFISSQISKTPSVQEKNTPGTQNPNSFSGQTDSVSYNPLEEYSSVKTFFRDENLFLNNLAVKEIYDIPESNLAQGRCIPYGYDTQNKIFTSNDKTHPRYGGSGGRALEASTSEKVLASLLKLRAGISKSIGHISLCSLYQGTGSEFGKSILVSEPSKDQQNKNVFVGLLGVSLDLISRAELKVPQDGYIASIDPVAYNFKDNIFYFKLSGKLNSGDVNLFKIDFNTNSYKTIYQGK